MVPALETQIGGTRFSSAKTKVSSGFYGAGLSAAGTLIGAVIMAGVGGVRANCGKGAQSCLDEERENRHPARLPSELQHRPYGGHRRVPCDGGCVGRQHHAMGVGPLLVEGRRQAAGADLQRQGGDPR